MEETLLAMFFAEDLSYQIYFSLGRIPPVNQARKIARKRLSIVSPYDTSVGQAVLHVINAHKAIADCYSELVRDGVSDHELVRNYLIEAVPLYFTAGYKHECFIAYCSTVIGVCAMYLEVGSSEDFVEVGIGVISTVLLGFIINKEFINNGEWSDLIDMCCTFNECEARRQEFIGQLNDKHEEYLKTKPKKKAKNIVPNKLVDTSTSKWFPFTDDQPKTSKAVVYQSSTGNPLLFQPAKNKAVVFTSSTGESFVYQPKNRADGWEGFHLAECESSDTVAEVDRIIPDVRADDPVASTSKSTAENDRIITSKSAAKRKKKKAKSQKKDLTEGTSHEGASEIKTPTKLQMLSPNKSTVIDISIKSITEMKKSLEIVEGDINIADPVGSSEPDPEASSDHLVENKSEKSDANEKTSAKRRKRKGKSGKSNNANAANNEDKSPHKIETKESSACARVNDQSENLLEDASKGASSSPKEQFESVLDDFVSKLKVAEGIEKE